MVSFDKALFGFLLDHMLDIAYVLVECKFLPLLSVKMMNLQAFFKMLFQLYHAVSCPFKVSTNLLKLSYAVPSPDPLKGFSPCGKDIPSFFVSTVKAVSTFSTVW